MLEADEPADIAEVQAWAAGLDACMPGSRDGLATPSHAGERWPTSKGSWCRERQVRLEY